MYCATQFFGLTLTEALFALRLIEELDIFSSKHLVALILLLGVVFGFRSYLLLKYIAPLRRGRAILMMLLGLIVLPVDLWLNMPRDSVFWLNMDVGLSFESVMGESGFMKLIE